MNPEILEALTEIKDRLKSIDETLFSQGKAIACLQTKWKMLQWILPVVIAGGFTVIGILS